MPFPFIREIDMAGPKLASGVKTKIYGKKGYTPPATLAYDELVGDIATKTSALVDTTTPATNLVNFVTDLGDVTKESNTIGFNVYGTDTQNNVAGFANLGEFTMTLALDESDDIHNSLLDGAVGDAWYIGILTATGADLSDNASITLLHVEIGGSALQQSADGVRSFNITWTLKSAPATYRA